MALILRTTPIRAPRLRKEGRYSFSLATIGHQKHQGQKTGASLSDLIASLVFLAIAAGAILWDHFVGFAYSAEDGWSSFLDPGLWPWWIGGLLVLMVLEALLAISVYA